MSRLSTLLVWLRQLMPSKHDIQGAGSAISNECYEGKQMKEIVDNKGEKKQVPTYDEMREMSARGYTWDGSQWRMSNETAAKKANKRASNRGEIKGI